MSTIAATRFKAQCLSILDEVKEKRHSVVITKRGKPVAKLIPIEEEKRKNGKAVSFGRLKGTGEIVGDIYSTGVQWEADA